MYILVTYVPPSHLQLVKEALFDAGAGKLGSYDRCSFQSLGEGQFRPLAGSSPFLGHHGSVERTEEWRLEMVVEDHLKEDVIAALRSSHPYETVAYHLIEVVT